MSEEYDIGFEMYQDAVTDRLLEFLDAVGIAEGLKDGIVDWIMHGVKKT